VPDQPVPSANLDPEGTPEWKVAEDTSFKAHGQLGAIYWFSWGHALHELTQPPKYSLGMVISSADPDDDTPIQTTHLDDYLLDHPPAYPNALQPFLFDFGYYEALNPQQKSVVQGFCKERIRILHAAWPTVDVRFWKLRGWLAPKVYNASGVYSSQELKSVCE